MFKTKTNQEIGEYFSKLISLNFKNQRQFGKAYLEKTSADIHDESLNRISNKITQIIKGNKRIQLDDLPIFCDLLHVTCEDLLSSGENFVPIRNRLTNYNVAFSNDKILWEEYINDKRQLILKTDEYEKTVIDYALEFKNYEFLKYLLDKKYIWFVDTDSNNYYSTFGAGTSIKRNPANICELDDILISEDSLRIKMIILAITNNDFETLTHLKAKEIPPLYQTYLPYDLPKIKEYYNKDLIATIAQSNDEVLDYFSTPFKIKNQYNKDEFTFIFPFIEQLLELLIKNKSIYLENILKNCIKHNQFVYQKLKIIINIILQKYASNNHHLIDFFKRTVTFNLEYQIIRIENLLNSEKFLSNIVKLNIHCNDSKIQNLINELNEVYNKIIKIKETI